MPFCSSHGGHPPKVRLLPASTAGQSPLLVGFLDLTRHACPVCNAYGERADCFHPIAIVLLPTPPAARCRRPQPLQPLTGLWPLFRCANPTRCHRWIKESGAGLTIANGISNAILTSAHVVPAHMGLLASFHGAMPSLSTAVQLEIATLHSQLKMVVEDLRALLGQSATPSYVSCQAARLAHCFERADRDANNAQLVFTVVR